MLRTNPITFSSKNVKNHFSYRSLNNSKIKTNSLFRSYSSSSKIRILKSTSTNPWFNLATEEWIFNDMDPQVSTLFLWRNDKTVVIGRHQNPWKECNIQKMEEDGVYLARRKSGGGAVYQDLGNTCFTFLSSRDEYNKDRNNEIINQALRDGFGIQAVPSGRNDIHVDGKKISGSAFKQTHDRAFHHGTMLIDIDTSKMQQYLNPNKAKLQSKGVSSVASRVLNLGPEFGVTHDAFCQSMQDAFQKYHGVSSCEIETLEKQRLESIPYLKEHYEQLKNWDWRFGQTPQFSHNFETRFDWGIMDIHVESQKGIITQVKVFSDTLFPQIVDQLEHNLLQKRYSTDGIHEAMKQVKDNLKKEDAPEQIQQYMDELENWLVKQL
eukprot:gb/GECH01007000.1/.p1 GENE.gb/GECH01007000.1/~~gb/GECH01007000.1/.p1  ORF type:complete len:380 (+),score=109.46 gb/GECH01007000.1/:1-1140(+)